MSEMKEYPPNTFSWVDLGTSDQNAAKKFYGELFGWSYEDMPIDDKSVYSMSKLKGKDAAAISTLSEEMASQGVPPNWLSYVSVKNADDMAKKARKLGATIVKEPFDVFDVGRMAVIQDPTGAVFALWQPKAHKGAALVNEHGALTWNELLTTDVDKAGSFYTKLFDWGSDTQDMGGFQYTSFKNGERPAGGMMTITKEMGEIPPNWLVYFAVDDCDKAVDKAKSLGAHVANPPTDIPEIGRFAVLVDPQGAVFSVIKLLNPQ